MSGRSFVQSRRALLAGGCACLVAGKQAGAEAIARDAPILRQNGRQFTILEPPRGVAGVRMTSLTGQATVIPAGRPALVNFFATWGPPCRRELPNLDALARTNRHALSVLAVGVDPGGATMVRPFVAKLGLSSLTVCVDPAAAVASDGRRASEAPFALYGLPITYVVDAAGRATGYIAGEVDWLSADATRFLEFFKRQVAPRG